MSLDDLRALVAAIDHNSLSRAAQALSITQSAISRRIQHLENSLGAMLFDRSSKPPRPTALAHRVYQQAQQLLKDADRLVQLARDDSPPTGVFRIGFTQLVADIVLFDAVRGLKQRFPALEIHARTAWTARLLPQLQRGELDAATLLLPHKGKLPAGLDGRFITALDMVVVQSRKQPLVASRTDLRALAAHEWILNPLGCGYRAVLERAMENVGHQLALSVDTHGIENQLRMISEGMGLGLVPANLLARSPCAPALVPVAVTDFSLKLDVWMGYPVQLGNLAQAAALMADTVAAGFTNERPQPAAA